MMRDLSFLIPSRNERFLARTIEDVLAHIRGDSEIIAVLDGAWADPPIPDHPRVQVIYRPTAIGQRAATNLAARLSTAQYVCKLDAHCAIDDGFDVKMIQAIEQCGPETTAIPAMYNLHAFNWRCGGCGVETYQGPTPTVCAQCQYSGAFERVLYWDRNAGGVPGRHLRTEFWRFDHELHFQYWSGYRRMPAAKGEIVDVMSSVGACFVMRRDRFHALGGLDESIGSWGQFGQEIACKSWLSGGRHVVHKGTWFAHLFRTQGGDFSFPYPMRNSDQEHARKCSRDMWYGNKWPGQTRPLSWLIEKFSPIPDWADPVGAAVLAKVTEAGRAFAARSRAPSVRVAQPTKGLVYYTDGRPDPRLLAAVRAQIQRAAPSLPVAVVTCAGVAPIDWPGAQHVSVPQQRGPLTMFRQILAGLEALDTDVVFHVEHDCLYSSEHFAFTPPSRDRFYYNEHRWQVSTETGRAVHYRCCQTAQLCADRQLLIRHYRARIAAVEAAGGYQRNMGYEPGTNRWSRALDGVGHETWRTTVPNLDLRHGGNLSKTRWSPDEFRDKRTCQGWIEADKIPGWDLTEIPTFCFLDDIAPWSAARRHAAGLLRRVQMEA